MASEGEGVARISKIRRRLGLGLRPTASALPASAVAGVVQKEAVDGAREGLIHPGPPRLQPII